ncbi:unnamed protein product, partial [Protopolystoma xenopodis]
VSSIAEIDQFSVESSISGASGDDNLVDDSSRTSENLRRPGNPEVASGVIASPAQDPVAYWSRTAEEARTRLARLEAESRCLEAGSLYPVTPGGVHGIGIDNAATGAHDGHLTDGTSAAAGSFRGFLSTGAIAGRLGALSTGGVVDGLLRAAGTAARTSSVVGLGTTDSGLANRLTGNCRPLLRQPWTLGWLGSFQQNSSMSTRPDTEHLTALLSLPTDSGLGPDAPLVGQRMVHNEATTMNVKTTEVPGQLDCTIRRAADTAVIPPLVRMSPGQRDGLPKGTPDLVNLDSGPYIGTYLKPELLVVTSLANASDAHAISSIEKENASATPTVKQVEVDKSEEGIAISVTASFTVDFDSCFCLVSNSFLFTFIKLHFTLSFSDEFAVWLLALIFFRF